MTEVHLQLMREPEKFVRLFPDLDILIYTKLVSKINVRKKESDNDLGESEYKDDGHGAVEKNPGDPGHRLEKPVTDVRHNA